MKKYDIFISYRRDGGDQSAKAIYDALKERGYNAFLDIETLRSGAFNTKLYSVIDECNDMIVVLSPNSLERCEHQDDWVRLEIAHALKKGKNVVPVMLRGFSFPDNLPEDINKLRFQNGIQASVEFFDAFIEKLCSFLGSKPGIIKNLGSRIHWKKIAISFACCILLAAGIWGAISIFHKNQTYPATAEEKNEVNQLLGYMENNIAVSDRILAEAGQALNACEDYLVNASEDRYEDLNQKLTHAASAIEQLSLQASAPSDTLMSGIKDSKIMAGDVEAVSQYPGIISGMYKGTIQNLIFVMDPNNPLDDATRNRIIDIEKQFVKLESDGIVVEICTLLLPVDDKALEGFRTEFLSSLGMVSNSLGLWSKDEVELKSQETNIENQEQKLLDDYSSLVGDMNYDTMAQNQEFEKQCEEVVQFYMTLGLSEEEARAELDKQLETIKSINDLAKETAELKKQLNEYKQQILEKCTPQEGDAPGLIWGKALRLMTAQMYDDAVNVMQYYMIQVKDSDEYAAEYVPAAISFVQQIGNTGIDYGILVAGYEPGKPQHDIYKIGDIIVAVNGSPCHDLEEYTSLRGQVPEGSDFTVTLLRSDDSGALNLTDVTVPAGQPRVAFMELTEGQE